MNSDTFIIARAGWGALAISLGAFAFFTMIDADFLRFLAFVAIVAIAWFYRNPERVVPYYQSGSIVSVADGTVLSIESVQNCALCKDPCYRIEIESGIMETSVLRAPFEAKVSDISIQRGARLNLKTPLAKELNEKATLKFTGSKGARMLVEHQLELTMAGISLNAPAGHTLMQGGRYGVMLKGVTTIYLPANCRISLQVGDTLSAGETLMGYFSASDEQ